MSLEKLPMPEPCIRWKCERKKICLSPRHNPPSHMVLDSGKYKWTCPDCGEVQIFEIPDITYLSGSSS